MSECPALSILTNHDWSCHVDKIRIYPILKIQNAISEIKRYKVWKSKVSWKIKIKH